MKRGTLVALGILVALLLVYFVTGEEPQQQEVSPLTIQRVEDLDRLEITPPTSSDEEADGPELIAFEKREDGWWLTQPVEAPAADSFGGTVDEQLGQAIETDALPIDSSKAANYGLDDGSVARLALYGAGADSPQVELDIGNQMSVESTGAVRTYIRQAGNDRIYRAQVELGDFVRKSVESFRSNEIVDLGKANLTKLTWEPAEGPTMVLEKNDESWTLTDPQVDWSLDTSAVDSIVGALGGLTAESFADDKKLADIGLEPPAVRLTAESGDRSTTLLVGRIEGEDGNTYYVKRDDAPFKYEISTYAGQQLIADLGDLRSKTPRTFDKEALSEVRFSGDDDVVVRKEEGSWTLVQPDAEESLNDSKLDRRLSTLAALEVKGFPDVDPAEVGLTAGADRVNFEVDGSSRAILFGDTVEESGERYVKFDDGDEVFLVDGRTVDTLFPAVDDLVGEGRPGPGKMPGGMKGMKRMPGGKGMPHGKGGPGGGMNKRQKMQMMKQLKKKMGN